MSGSSVPWDGVRLADQGEVNCGQRKQGRAERNQRGILLTGKGHKGLVNSQGLRVRARGCSCRRAAHVQRGAVLVQRRSLWYRVSTR